MAQLSQTDASSIANAARCFNNCTGGSAESSLKTYLLTQTAGIATPPCITPDAPILSAGAKVITDTTLRILWNQISNSGSLITSYTVFWGTSSGVYTNSAVVPVIPRIYTITGLTSGTQYFFAVQANSSAAVGCQSALSNEANATTSGSPPGPCAAGVTYTNVTWQANVTANVATTPSVAVQNALATFYCGLQTDGTLNSILWLQLMVPGAVGAVTDNAGGRALAGTAFIFVKGTTGLGGGSSPLTAAGFLDIQGVTGNFPASSFYDTGFNPSTAFASSQSAGWFIYATSPSKTGYSFGVFASPGNNFSGLAQFTDGNAYSAIGVTGTNNVVVASPGRGFYSGQRVSNVDHRLYFANEATAFGQIGATDAIAFNGVLPNANAYIWAEDTIGTGAQTPSQDQLHAVGYTTGLSSASVQLIYNRLRKLLLDLGVSLTNGFLNSLVSYWRIDGALGTLTPDSKGSNTLTAAGGASNGSGGPLPGTGYYGNGGTMLINPCPANLRLGGGASFTFQIWLKGTVGQFNAGTFAGQYGGLQANSAWVFFANAHNPKLICYSTDSTQQNVVWGATLVEDNATWNHCVVGYDATSKTMFMQLNGGVRVTAATTADLNSVATQIETANDATNADPFGGATAQAAFWNVALTSAQVISLYNSGKGVPFGAFTV